MEQSQQNDPVELIGTAEQIIYRNETNGYTVLTFETEDDMLTVVGTLPNVQPGENLRILGQWTQHPNFGRQFKAEVCETALPVTAAAMLKYLSSGAVKGIGRATAARIMDAFGEKALDVIEQEPQRLTSIRGISQKKAEAISESYRSQFGVREVMLFFAKYSLSQSMAVKAFKLWGNLAVEKISQNPYLLCTEGMEAGFEKADKMAVEMGLPQDAPFRLRTGLEHVLRHNICNGHTCIPADRLIEAAAGMLSASLRSLEDTYQEMVTDGTLIEEDFGGRGFVFLPFLHRAETYAAARLRMMLTFPPTQYYGLEEDIKAAEKAQEIEYQELQKEAVEAALTKGLLVLTGGPGTGKTTTLNIMIKILKEKGERVFLAAPTGRAAKRMTMLTGEEAKTLHRLLEAERSADNTSHFNRNENNLLDCDTLIVDEFSMMNVQLFEALLKSLRLGCRLVMVGDSDQLPSIGAGNVLGDLIDSGVVPVVSLTEIFRQAESSAIVTNAHKIVRGEMPDLRVRDSDFFFLHTQTAAEISETINDLCASRLPKRYGYTLFDGIQVLAPSRKGDLGTFEINRKLQEKVNPPARHKKEIVLGNVLLRQGDKVMQTKNNYDIGWERSDGTTGSGIFNGDIGILTEIRVAEDELDVVFDGRLATYTLEEAKELESAFAVTVHKSQGNEFDAVVMPMYPGPPMLYYRNLLYTAITRAKNLLILVGTPQTVEMMVSNDRKTRRYTGMRWFLQRSAESDAIDS